MHSTKYMTLLALLGVVSVSGSQKVKTHMSKIKNLNQVKHELYCDEIPEEVVDNYIQVPEQQQVEEQLNLSAKPSITNIVQDYISRIPTQTLSYEAGVVREFAEELPYCDEVPKEVVEFFQPIPEVPTVVFDESIGGFTLVSDPSNPDSFTTNVLPPAPETQQAQVQIEEPSVSFYRYVEQTGQYVIISEPSPYVQQYYTWNEPSQLYVEVPTQIVYSYFEASSPSQPSVQVQEELVYFSQETPQQVQESYSPWVASESIGTVVEPSINVWGETQQSASVEPQFTVWGEPSGSTWVESESISTWVQPEPVNPWVQSESVSTWVEPYASIPSQNQYVNLPSIHEQWPVVQEYIEELPYCDEVEQQEQYVQLPDVPTLAVQTQYVPDVYQFISQQQQQQQIPTPYVHQQSTYEVFVPPQQTIQQQLYVYVPETQNYVPAVEITPLIQTYYKYSEPTQSFVQVPYQYIASIISEPSVQQQQPYVSEPSVHFQQPHVSEPSVHFQQPHVSEPSVHQQTVEVCATEVSQAPQLFTYIESIDDYVPAEPSPYIHDYYTYSEITEQYVELPVEFVRNYYGGSTRVVEEEVAVQGGNYKGFEVVEASPVEIYTYIDEIEQFVAITAPHESIEEYFVYDEGTATYVEVPVEEVVQFFEQSVPVQLEASEPTQYVIPQKVHEIFEELPECSSVPTEVIDYYTQVPDVTVIEQSPPVVFTYDPTTQQYTVASEPSPYVHEYYVWSEPSQTFVQIPSSQTQYYFPPTQEVYYDESSEQYYVGYESSPTIELYSYNPRTRTYTQVSEPTPDVETYYTYNEYTRQYEEYTPQEPVPIQEIYEQLPECEDVPEDVVTQYVQIPDVPSVVSTLDWTQIYAWSEPTQTYVPVSEPSQHYQDYYTWSDSIQTYIQIPNTYLDYFFEDSVDQQEYTQQETQFYQQYSHLYQPYTQQIQTAYEQIYSQQSQSQPHQYTQQSVTVPDLYTWVPSIQQYVYVSEQTPYIQDYYTYDESTQSYTPYVPSAHIPTEVTQIIEELPECDDVPTDVIDNYIQIPDIIDLVSSQSTPLYTFDVATYSFTEVPSQQVQSGETYYSWSESSQQFVDVPSVYIDLYVQSQQQQSQQSQPTQDLYVYVPQYDQYVYVSEPSPYVTQYYVWSEPTQQFVSIPSQNIYTQWVQTQQQQQSSQSQHQQSPQQQQYVQSSQQPVTYQQLVSEQSYVPTYTVQTPELYIYDESSETFVEVSYQTSQQIIEASSQGETFYYWDQPTQSYHIYQQPSQTQYYEEASPYTESFWYETEPVDLYFYDETTQNYFYIDEPSPFISTYYTYDESSASFVEYSSPSIQTLVEQCVATH